jgi:hypothetical protein
MRIRAWLGALVASASIALGVPAAAHAAPPPFGYQKEVVASFTDGAGRPVLLRRGWYLGGTGGFGWDKIFHKHGITNMNLVEKIIKNPRGGKQEGTSRVYEGFAQRFRCDISGRCAEVERIPVKAVVEFRNDPNLGMGQKGVITAFCNFGPGGPTLCPGWVNTVANVAPA